MIGDEQGGLTFATLFSDPLIRLVMASDGVSPQDLIAVLEVARTAVEAREREAIFAQFDEEDCGRS